MPARLETYAVKGRWFASHLILEGSEWDPELAGLQHDPVLDERRVKEFRASLQKKAHSTAQLERLAAAC